MTAMGLDATVRVDRGGFLLDATVRAAPGETLALMGPSGAGKSTLLGVLAGFTPLSAGAIVLDGTTMQNAAGIDVPPRQRGVILLGQQPRLFPHLSARDNIAFGLRTRGVRRAQARADADAWMERIGLAGMGGRRPAQLSGGQQQRVALARALATRPRMLLLDEPLVSLDLATATGIRTLLRDALTETTTIMATHDPADATALADRLIVLEGGTVTADAAPQTVFARGATGFIAALSPESAWQVRIEQVETDATGIRARAGTRELRFPADAPVVPGSIVTVRPPR